MKKKNKDYVLFNYDSTAVLKIHTNGDFECINLVSDENKKNMIMSALDIHFSILKNTILDSCKEYLKELGYVFEDIYISSSWGVVTPTEKQTNVHIHGNSWISGTYYFTGGSPISFWKSPQKGTYVGQKEFNPDNPRTFGAYNITPIPGTLVLFPSTLEHKVEISNNELPRISLAFNIIPTGVFGPPTARIYPPKI